MIKNTKKIFIYKVNKEIINELKKIKLTKSLY